MKLLKMDGFDDCVVGVVERFGIYHGIICYDYDKVIAKLERDGMSAAEASEWYEFNMIGAWLGDDTPCFVRQCSMDEINDMGGLCE